MQMVHVGRACWSTKENRQPLVHHGKFAKNMFGIFPAHGKNDLTLHEMVPGRFFPTNPDLADILGDIGFDFDN